MVVSACYGSVKSTVGKTTQVPPFAPVNELQAIHLVDLAEQFFVMAAWAIAPALDIVIQQKPSIHRSQSALFLVNLLSDRIHVASLARFDCRAQRRGKVHLEQVSGHCGLDSFAVEIERPQ
ncbi:hypothetical protein ACIPZF_18000 [Pseudomonas sp. NPDC089752]|uniref:hypothetical protein n=1 Tax=Pseudomonas sp. NPDC089752 TaxID=3364472 RepID=UPI00380EB099